MINKKTYLEYYDVSLTNKGDDVYYIEIRSTQKKPISWDKVKIFVFDTWHDDLKYCVTTCSNFIWIEVKSKYGIGSITFIPDNIDEKHKDYLIIHEYVKKEEFKPVIGVFVYPNTSEIIQNVKEHLISLKNTNIPIYLCSNMGCPDELIELCDGFIYTGPNEFCNIPTDILNKQNYIEYSIKNPIIIPPDNFKFYHNHSLSNGKGTYLFSATKSIKIGTDILEKKGYTHIMVSEGEFVLDDKDIEKPLEILKDLWINNIVLDFFYTKNSRYLQAYLWFGNLKHITNSFVDITKKDKHYPKNNENSNANAFLLCEKYYQHKLLSYNPSAKIRVRTIEDNVENVINRYWYSNRTDLLIHKNHDFKLEQCKTNELLSFFLYFSNTKKVFLSIANKNMKSDMLNSNSFDLGVSEMNDNRLVAIVKNFTRSKTLNFKLNLINDNDEVITEILFDECVPDIWRFVIIKKPINYSNKYNYSVSLTDNNEVFYKGQFNY
jgi:hypothetical protein